MSKNGKVENQAASGTTITRRELVTRAGLGAGALLLTSGMPEAFAAAPSKTIKVGFVSPLSGPLAGFGEGDPYVLGLVRKKLASGIKIGGQHYAVDIVSKDSQSDPTRASQLAKELINRDMVDLMLSTSTPEVVNPVADACEAAGVPSMSTTVPWESWYFGRGAKPGAPSPFKWTYHFSFGVADFAKCYVGQWAAPVNTNKICGVLYPNDADGNAVREHLIPLLDKGGYKIIDAGGYEDGTADFSVQIAKFKAADCQVFNTFPIPPDFATFWRQAAQQGYTRMVKIAQIAKTGLFPSQVEALGSLGYNLATGAYWAPVFPYKSSLTGLSSAELTAGYEKTTGRQWNQQLGATMSLFDAGFAALEASGQPKNKADVAKAMSKLKVTTMEGHLDWTKGPVPNVVTTPIIGCQWVKAKPGSKFKLDLVMTNNADDPNVPVAAQLKPYNS